MQQWHGAAWSSATRISRQLSLQVNGYLMSHSVENFDLSVYLLRGG